MRGRISTAEKLSMSPKPFRVVFGFTYFRYGILFFLSNITQSVTVFVSKANKLSEPVLGLC